MKLLVSQKDSLFQLIEAIDFFSYNQFEIIESEILGDFKTHIEYRSNKTFRFNFNDSEYDNRLHLNYSPGNEQLINSTSDITWNQALNHFSGWLNYLHREIISPNLWDKFKNEVSQIKLVNNFNNQKFSFSEFTEISEKINILKDSLSSIPLILDQQKELILRLDHLNETAKVLGKFDWINLFIGTMISVFTQLNISPKNANAIWDMIKRVLNNYILLNS